MSYSLPEPPFQDDDTSPGLAYTKSSNQTANRILSWLLLSLSGIVSVGTVVVLLWPAAPAPAPIILAAPTNAALAQENNSLSQAISALEPVEVGANSGLPPLVDAQQLHLLQQPLDSSVLMSYRYEPFTTVSNERPRSAFVDYVAVQGDTLDAIAERYAIKTESIAWCNDRRLIQVLRPGDIVKIPPIDGACHRVLASREETITSIAADFQISDPYTIIDSPFNYGQLPNGVQPDDILPGGINLFIPGGQGAAISWNAAVTETDANGNVLGVSFAAGLSGSCGTITPSSGSFWGNPLPNGTWVRGFSIWHTGLDLAAPTGTPIYAANSGQVIFSGVSTWGYGEAVVIEHGSTFSTLYGHMSNRNVSCGQSVVTGQVIGFVGSTGVSTGPHLHFEIRVNGQPVEPSGTPGIGW